MVYMLSPDGADVKCCMPEIWGTSNIDLNSGEHFFGGITGAKYGGLAWYAVKVPGQVGPNYATTNEIKDQLAQPFSSRDYGYAVPGWAFSYTQSSNGDAFPTANILSSRTISESGNNYVVYLYGTRRTLGGGIQLTDKLEFNNVEDQDEFQGSNIIRKYILDLQTNSFLSKTHLFQINGVSDPIGAQECPWWQTNAFYPESLDAEGWAEKIGHSQKRYGDTDSDSIQIIYCENTISMSTDWFIITNHAGGYYGSFLDTHGVNSWLSQYSSMPGGGNGQQSYWAVQRFPNSDPTGGDHIFYYEGLSGPDAVSVSDNTILSTGSINPHYFVCLGAVHAAPWVIAYKNVGTSQSEIVTGRWLNSDFKEPNVAVADREYRNVAHLQSGEVINTLGTLNTTGIGVIYYDRKNNLDMAIVRTTSDGKHWMTTGNGFFEVSSKPTCMAIDDNNNILFGSVDFLTKSGVNGWTVNFSSFYYNNSTLNGKLIPSSPFATYIDYNDKWYLLNGIASSIGDFDFDSESWIRGSTISYINLSQFVNAAAISKDGTTILPMVQWYGSGISLTPGTPITEIREPAFVNRLPVDIGGHKYKSSSTSERKFSADWSLSNVNSDTTFNYKPICANYSLVK